MALQRKGHLHEAVEKPTTAQRSDLPDAAYAAVFEVDGRIRKILPHHVNTAKSAAEDASVDLPRLRNALARAGQLKGVPAEIKRRALEHIEAHAKRLKLGAREAAEDAPIVESLALIADETVDEFCCALHCAIEDAFELEEVAWFLCDVASEWAVIEVLDEDEWCHYQIPYTRDAAGAFALGEPIEVRPRKVYVVVPEEDEEGEGVEGEPASEAKRVRKFRLRSLLRGVKMTGPTMAVGSVSAAGESGESAATQEKAAPDEHVSDYFRLDEYTVQSGEQVTETAPNGKRYMAVLEGEGGVLDEINLNNRLYLSAHWGENEERLRERIEKAYAYEKDGARPNPHLVLGPVDHGLSGVEVMSLATHLLRAERVGNRIKVRFGLMDTAPALHALKLREWSVPLGVSWEAYGKKRQRVMDEKNPLYQANRAHSGRQYDEVGPYRVERFALVVDPAAMTFLDSHDAPPEAREVVSGYCRTNESEDAKTYQAIVQAPGRNEISLPRPNESATPAAVCEATETTVAETAAITQQTQEPIMDEQSKKLEETIAALTADKTTLEEAVTKAAADLAEAKAQLEERDKQLVEASEKIKTFEAEAARAKLLESIEAVCAGKPWGDSRRGFLKENAHTVEDVARFADMFDRYIAPSLPVQGVNERERTTENVNPEPNKNHGAPALGIGNPITQAR